MANDKRLPGLKRSVPDDFDDDNYSSDSRQSSYA